MKRGNGFGSVIKLAGKRRNPFAARVTTGWTNEGKQIIKYIGYYPTKREAVKALEAYNTDPYELGIVKLTTLDVYEKWLAQQKMSVSGLSTYMSSFKKAIMIHGMLFEDVKLMHLEQCMELQTATMKKPFKAVMQNLYKYAIKHEIVNRNLADLLEYETIKSKERRTFEVEHIDILWKNLGNHPHADIPLIMLYTGVRINELLKLKSENVNMKERYLITGSKTDAGKDRVIPIHDKIVPLIEKRLAEGHPFLITNDKGYPIHYKTLQPKIWPYVVKEVVGVDYTAHETRHTFITHMNKVGVNRALIQRIVGHASREVTDIYIHNSIDELLQAINQLEYK